MKTAHILYRLGIGNGHEFFHEKVVEHFVEASTVYANRRGVVHKEDPEILDIISNSGITRGRIFEIGGGSGDLLDLIDERTNAFRLYNCDLTWQAYRRQVNPVINLVGGNILSLPFDECEFDFVITKNLLHHLVGKTREASKKLAQLATMELIRVSKRCGHVILLEQPSMYIFFIRDFLYYSHSLHIGKSRWGYGNKTESCGFISDANRTKGTIRSSKAKERKSGCR